MLKSPSMFCPARSEGESLAMGSEAPARMSGVGVLGDTLVPEHIFPNQTVDLGPQSGSYRTNWGLKQ